MNCNGEVETFVRTDMEFGQFREAWSWVIKPEQRKTHSSRNQQSKSALLPSRPWSRLRAYRLRRKADPKKDTLAASVLCDGSANVRNGLLACLALVFPGPAMKRTEALQGQRAEGIHAHGANHSAPRVPLYASQKRAGPITANSPQARLSSQAGAKKQ